MIIEGRIPGPGDRIDDHTVFSDDVEFEHLHDAPVVFDYGTEPVGEVLEISLKDKHFKARVRVDSEKLEKVMDGMHFQPAFIVKEWETKDGMVFIHNAELVGISIGFRCDGVPKKMTWWQRFVSWLKGKLDLLKDFLFRQIEEI